MNAYCSPNVGAGKPGGLMRLQSENPSQYKHDFLCMMPRGLKVGQQENPNVQELCSAFTVTA